MKPKTIYIIVEGPHDSSVVSRVIQSNGLGFVPISLRVEVDSYWDNLVPKSFPQENPKGQPEFGRVRVPDFLKADGQTLALQSSGGIHKLPGLMRDDLELLGEKIPDAIGVIIDADSTDAITAYKTLKRNFERLNIEIKLPNDPGEVMEGAPRSGAFVFPNNRRQGTLEDTMLECAGISYPQLIPIANSAVDAVSNALCENPNWLPASEREEFQKPAGPNKARISIIGSVMKPTFAIGNSYRQQNWITKETLGLPLVGELSAFLTSLLGEH